MYSMDIINQMEMHFNRRITKLDEVPPPSVSGDLRWLLLTLSAACVHVPKFHSRMRDVTDQRSRANFTNY